MNKLTNYEVKMLDNYIISNNYTELTEADFHQAIANIVPTWRSEQLADNRTYDFSATFAYQDYIKNLYSGNQV